MFSNHPNSATVTFTVGFNAKLKHALTLFPQTSEIHVVVGNSELDKSILVKLKAVAKKNEKQVSFQYLENMNKNAILNIVKNLPDNSFVYFLSYSQEINGKPYISKQFSRDLANNCNRPVFSYLDLFTEHTKILGEIIVSQKSTVLKTIEIIEKVFNETNINNIPLVLPDEAYTYDRNELKKWNIDINKLPPESIFYNRKYNFLEMYKYEVIGIIILLFTYTALLLLLLFSNIKRKKSEERLSKQNLEYTALNEKYEVINKENE